MNARPSPLEVLHDYMEMTNNYLFDDKNVDQDPIRILDQWNPSHYFFPCGKPKHVVQYVNKINYNKSP